MQIYENKNINRHIRCIILCKKNMPKKDITFRDRVFEVVRKIPEGKTLTYKEVAEKAGSPKAYRAVGNILHTNYDPKIPCHRVVRSDGKTSGWNRGAEEKEKILNEERKR